MSQRVSKDEVEKAQNTWAQGIVAIGKAHDLDGDYVRVAENLIDQLYAFASGTVLFKPTKASEAQFRGTREEALSYFVASNGACSEDKGFALQPWTAVRFENSDVILGDNYALAMGNYYFTDKSGSETKVEYSFGYTKDALGDLRIQLHHSSLPFTG